MGFFDGLFGRKKIVQKQKKSDQKQKHFFTNSLDFDLGKIEMSIAGKLRVDGVLAFAEMEKIAKLKGLPFEFHGMHTTLLEEGALTVPAVCSIGEIKYSLYFIYQKEDLAKYKDLAKQIGRTDYPNLIYFSAISMDEVVNAQTSIAPLQMADLQVIADAKVAGQFSMWWQSKDEGSYHKSITFNYLQRLYELVKGYETYIMGYVLRQAGVTNDAQLQRMRLLEENVSYILDAPEHKRIIMNLSQEKGVRFLFPIQRTSKMYRERFLQAIVNDFEAVIRSLKQQNVPRDEILDPNSYDWFNFMSNVVKQKEEEGESIDQIGTINLNSQLN